jgi:putative ABC transport system permease protein
MHGLLQDFRFALRMLLRKPGFSALLILTLAVGVGGTTAMYSVIEAVVLRPLPYVDDTRVMIISGDNLKELNEWGTRSFDVLADYVAGGADFALPSGTQRILASETSEDFFAVFGVQPALGRTYTSDEVVQGRDRVAVLSDTLWRHEFASSKTALGATIHLNGVPYTVIGVMPPRFTFPGKTALWAPMPEEGRSLELTRSEQTDLPAIMNGRAVARLRAGITLEAARVEMEDLRQRMVHSFAGTNRRATSHIGVNPVTWMLSLQYRYELFLLLAAGGFVLLIGCVNVAGLLLARGAVRRREIAVRLCLGAGRWRVARQLLAESFLLAALSSLAGIGLAWTFVILIRSFGPPDMPRLSEATVNARALLFALGVAQLAGILAALWPAFQSSAVQLGAALHQEGPSGTGRLTQRGRRVLTVAEIALALMLAVGAGVALRGLHDTLKMDLNFQPEHVLTMRVSPRVADNAKPAEGIALRHRILEQMQGLPGLVAAAEVANAPFSQQSGGGWYLDIDGKLSSAFAEIEFVEGDYFSTYGLPLLAGRPLTRADSAETEPVVVINETLSKLFGGPTDAIGKQLHVEAPRKIWRIVGVAADARVPQPLQVPSGEVYFPFGQIQPKWVGGDLAILVRAAGDPTGLESEIRRRLARVLSDSPVFQVKTLDAAVLDSVAEPRFNSTTLAGFAGVAMMLALVGIYGVVAFSVAQRTHEIGVRIALGAEPSHILRMVLGEGIKLGVGGIAAGLALVWALRRLLVFLFFGVRGLDVTTVAIASVLLLGMTLLACAVPARRASRVHPSVALRYE